MCSLGLTDKRRNGDKNGARGNACSCVTHMGCSCGRGCLLRLVNHHSNGSGFTGNRGFRGFNSVSIK